MDVDTGIKLLLKALKAGEKTVTSNNIEIVVVRKDSIKTLSKEDLKKYI